MIDFVVRQNASLVLRPGGRPAFGRHVAVIAALVAGLAAAGPGSAAPPEEISGVWLTDDGEGAIEIRPCGADRCGRIFWMKPPKIQDASPLLDRNNPEPGLRSRPVCGLQIISELKAQTDGGWGEGRVYSPQDGKVYDMEIRRRAPDTVEATGYIGFTLLGRTMEWRRAPANLKSCTEAAAPKR